VLPPVILSILKWADSQDYPDTIVGAVAVCLHGFVRTTDDVDLLVMTTDSPSQVLESLEAAGYEPRFADPVVFAEASRVLLVRHSESGVDVDVMLGMLPFEQDCVDGSVVKRASFGTIRIAAPEPLCVMKLIAGRPHDMRDVAQLVEAFPKLDRAWILAQMQQFAELMELPEALDRARAALG
jgi:hypothetical protein